MADTPKTGPDPVFDPSKIQLPRSAPRGNNAYIGSRNFADFGKSKYDNAQTFIDPNHIDTMALDPESDYLNKSKQLEASRDRFQPWYDKAGNGLAKFGGSLASSVLSLPGTIYGIAALPYTLSQGKGMDGFWDNPFTEMGNAITDYTSQNFKNHRTMAQQNANPWSPTFWANWNFFTDAILGNAGYAVGAYVTGGGVSKALSKLAPLVATGKLKQGLQLFNEGGMALLEKYTDAAKRVRAFDRLQAGVSIGISAMSEASIEARGAADEFKRSMIAKLADEYGGEEKIPQSRLDQIEELRSGVGNVTYGINIPILTGVNALQFGKSLLGFKSETNAIRKQVYNFTRDAESGIYNPIKEVDKVSGLRKRMYEGFRNNLIPGFKNNLSEAAQEGVQFIASEGTKNYYGRKYDEGARLDTEDMIDAYMKSVNDLFKTEEGVTNLLAGFFTPGAMPIGPGGVFNHKDLMKLFLGDRGAKLKRTNEMIEYLNKVGAKSQFKEHFETMARDRSIQRDLNDALQTNNEREARNLEFDKVKNVISNRIKAGRFDLLQEELDEYMKMDKDEFKAFLGLQTDEDFDHRTELKKYQETAKDMHKTWNNLDVLFRPSLYKINSLDEDKKAHAIQQMDAYKEVAWSYLMDAKDSEKRERQLSGEVDRLAAGVTSIGELFSDKTSDPELNDLIKTYNQIYLEHHVRKASDNKYAPDFTEKELQAQLGVIKGKISKHINNKGREGLGLPEYVEKGDPSALEEFLFDVTKRIDKMEDEGVLRQAFGSRTLGGPDALYDINDFVKKIDDYRGLSMRRMMAINSYNNLATIIGKGTFADAMVKNPNYDPKDKTKGDEYIDNFSFLNTDHYKNVKTWKEKYMEERLRVDQWSVHDQEVLKRDLQREMGINAFRDRVSAYRIDEMSAEQFNKFADDTAAQVKEHAIKGTFDMSRKDIRDNFPKDQWLELEARKAAVQNFLYKHEQNIQKWLQKIDDQYRAMFVRDGQQVAQDFIQAMVDGIDPELADRLKEVIDQTTKALLTPAATDPTLAPVVVAPPAPTGGPVVNAPTRTPASGGSLVFEPTSGTSNNEEAVEESNDRLSNQIDKVTKMETDTYLTARRSDLETKEVERWRHIRQIDKIGRSKKYKIEDKEYTFDLLADKVNIFDSAGKKSVMTLQEFSTYLQTHRVSFHRMERANVYNDKGRVVNKQFNADLMDPNSELFLFPGRLIRIVPSGVVSKDNKDAGAPMGKYQVQNKKGEWVDTGYAHPFTRNRVLEQYRADELPPAVLERVKDEVDAMGAALLKGETIEAEILPNGINAGKLVTNEGDRGERKPTDIFFSFGKNYINNPDPKVTGRVFLGAIDSDGAVDANIIQIHGNQIRYVSDIDDVHIPQAMVDALTSVKRGDKRIALEKAGQFVAALPTAVKIDGRTMYIPVMLNTRNLNTELSSQYTRGDGLQMSIGEAVLDVLLNPGLEQNREAIAQMFKLVGQTYNADKPNWEALYTDDNIYQIINRVFHAGGKTIGNTKYKYPFSIRVVEPEQAGGAIALSIDITRDTTRLSKARKQAYIHITTKDGKLNTNPVQARMEEYFKNSDKAQPFDYTDIQDVIRQKPFRVDLGLASQPAITPYQALSLNDIGDVVLKEYPSYLDYLADQKILSSTVQSIQDNGRQFFFVNNQIRYERKAAITSAKRVAKKAAKKEPFAAKSTMPAERQQQQVKLEPAESTQDQITALFGPMESMAGTPTTPAEALSNKKIPKSDEVTKPGAPAAPLAPPVNINIKVEAYAVAASSDQRIPSQAITQDKNEATIALFHKSGNEYEFEAVNHQNTRKQFLYAPTMYRTFNSWNQPKESDYYISTRERGVARKEADGSYTILKPVQVEYTPTLERYTGEAVAAKTTPATSSIGNAIRNFKAGGTTKAMLDITSIQSVDQMVIPALRSQMPIYLADIRKMMFDLLLDEHNTGNKRATDRNYLKNALKARMEKSIVELNEAASKLAAKGQDDTTIGDRIAVRELMLRYFDSEDFDTTLTEDEKQQMSHGKRVVGLDGQGNPIYKNNYFVGFFNMAINELFKARIIKAYTSAQEEIVFHEEESLGYNTRFNDNWSFEIDPRSTMGSFARVIMHTVPAINLDDEGNVISEKTGVLGETEYLPYETVNTAMVNLIGLSTRSDEAFQKFESIGARNADNTAVDPTLYFNPTLRAVHNNMMQTRAYYGNHIYRQQLRRLLNPILLQQAGYKVIAHDKEGRGAKDRSYKQARQLINHLLVEKWSRNLTRIIKGGKYVEAFEGVEDGVPYTNYRIKPITFTKETKEGPVEITGSLSEYLTYKISQAATLSQTAKKGEIAPQYMALADIYVNDLGFALSEEGTVESTARVLSALNKTKRNSKSRIFHSQFKNHAIYGRNLSQFVQQTVVEFTIKKLENSLSTDPKVRSTFVPEEPFSDSTDILNRYARLTKGYFQDTMNVSARGSDGTTRYIYVPRNNISIQMLNLKDPEYMFTLVNAQQNKYHPILSRLFKRDENNNYISANDRNEEEWDRWTEMELDYVTEFDNDGQIIPIKDAKAGAWDIASIKSFQNAEKWEGKTLAGSLYRDNADYMMAFGDASVAPYYRAAKHRVAFDFRKDDQGNWRISLKENIGEEENPTQVSQALTIMMQAFKNDVNKAIKVIQQYKEAVQTNDFSGLRYGYHYMDVNGKRFPGTGAYVYTFGNKIFDQLKGENSFVFTTEVHNGERYINGIQDYVLDDKGEMYHVEGFAQDMVNGMINDMIDDKMQKMQPFMDQLLTIEPATGKWAEEAEASGGIALGRYNFPSFDKNYVKSFMDMTKGEVVTVNVDGDRVQLSDLRKYHQDNVVFNQNSLYTDSAPAIMLRAMLADHLINHFIFSHTWQAAHGADAGFYQKMGSVSYAKFYDTWNKRMKQYVTPIQVSATDRSDTLNILAFNDPMIGGQKVTVTKEQQETLGNPRSAMFDFLKANAKSLKGFVTINEDGSVTLPRRTFRHQAEAYLALNRSEWEGEYATKQSKDKVINDLVHYWSGLYTDGYSMITLKEYLYRHLLDGAINEQEFLQLEKFYSDPFLRVTDENQPAVTIQGMKYVASGTKIENGLINTLYKKDGEFVLLPSMTHGNPVLDTIRKQLERMETPGIAPGIVLSPMSALKIGGAQPINLLDDNNKVTDFTTAKLDVWPRTVSGKQVQNPDKEYNETTASTQFEDFVHYNAGSVIRFGTNIYTREAAPIFDAARELPKGMEGFTAERIPKDKKKRKPGVDNREMMINKHFAKGALMRRDLMKLMGDWGLRFDRDNAEYNAALERLGIDPRDKDHFKKVKAISQDPNSENRGAAFHAIQLRDKVVSTNLERLLEDLKAQAFSRKGIDVNNVFALKVAENMHNVMEIPTTFVASTVQFQSIILSRINKVIVGRKLPGLSGVQTSGFGYTRGKATVQGNEELKGYTPQYDKDGNLLGLNPAEIILPWRFRDPLTGKLLDYNKYVDADGVPIPEMWDDEMLTVIGLRIPGVGVNTGGRMRAVKFFPPGNRDMVAVAPEIAVQMNADYDFDKMPVYFYNFRVDTLTGKVKKIQGILSQRDSRLDGIISEDHITRAKRHMLLQTDPNYELKYRELELIVNAKVQQILDGINEREGLEAGESHLFDMPIGDRIYYLHEVGNFTEAQLEPLMKVYRELYKAEKESLTDFDIQKYLNDEPRGLVEMQSNEELQNALVESFHMMLSHTEIAKRMLDPLTTDWVKNQVDDKEYDGAEVEGKEVTDKRSLRELKHEKDFYSPTSESSMAAMRINNADADQQIGIQANQQRIVFLMQAGNLMIGEDRPEEGEEKEQKDQSKVIAFYDDKLQLIGEDDFRADNSIFREKEEYGNLSRIEQDKNASTRPMRWDKVGSVRYRLNRFYGYNAAGEKVYVTKVVQSLLQSALDNANDPLIGTININNDTADAALIMAGLRYFDHIVPFINQPIIEDFVIRMRNANGKPMNEVLEEMLDFYATKAGLEGPAWSKSKISPAKLKRAITLYKDSQRTNQPLPANFYAFQMDVLLMFSNLKKYGQAALNVQQAHNVDTKGLKDTTLVGVEAQIENFGKHSDLLLNSDNIERNLLFNHNLAYDYGLKPIRDLFEHGNIGMFSDLKPAFKTMRNLLATSPNPRRKNKVNIALRQFFLSNPQIYGDLLSDLKTKGRMPTDTADIRRRVMKENYALTTEGQLDLTKNLNKSLATLIDEVSDKKTPEGIPYYRQYEILGVLKPVVQTNNTRASVITYLNANNYKQNLDLLLPSSIINMLRSDDVKLQKIARLLTIYPYLVGGTDSPISFVRSVPQELLVAAGFGEQLRNIMSEMDRAFTALNSDYEENKATFQEDPRPKAIKLLSGDYTKGHRQALGTARAFVRQYIQHNPYEFVSPEPFSIMKQQADGSWRIQSDDADLVESLNNRLGLSFSVKEESDTPGGRPTRKTKVFVNNLDGSFDLVNSLGIRNFNVSEYSYNSNSAAGDTVVDVNRPDYAPTPQDGQSVPLLDQLSYAAVAPYRYKTKEEDVASFTSTVPKMLEWARESALLAASEMSNPASIAINQGHAALADYLMSKMPAGLPFSLKEGLESEGRAARAVVNIDPTTRRVTGVTVDPIKMKDGGNERLRLMGMLLHEATHASTSHAIDIAKMVSNGTITAQAGADRLGMKLKEFERVLKAVDHLDTLRGMMKERRSEFEPYFSGTAEDQLILENAFSNVDEFVATVFSDSRFRKALNEIGFVVLNNRKRKSIMQRLMELFKDLLGIRDGSALEEAFYNIMEITEAYTPTVSSELSENQGESATKASPDISALADLRANNNKKFTRDYRIDKYIDKLSETRMVLKRQLPTFRTDLLKQQELNKRVQELDKHIALLKEQQNTTALVDVGQSVLAELQDGVDRADNYTALHEGMRLSKVYTEIDQVLDFGLEDPNEEEKELIEQARTIRSMAADIFKLYFDKYRQKVIDDISGGLGRDVSKKLLNGEGKVVITDIDKTGSLFIYGGYSENEMEQYVDKVLEESEKRAHDEYYAFETDLAKRVRELNGKLLHEVKADDFQFLLEPVGKSNSAVQLITKYDRNFYKDLAVMKHLAFDKRKGDNYNTAVMLGADPIEDFKKKVTKQDFYQFEKQHFDYVLTPEGKADFEQYMADFKEQISEMDENGNKTFDQNAYDKEYRKYDPEQFLKYVNGEEGVRFNSGRRWITTKVKNVPLNAAYQKMDSKQREFYEWYASQIVEGKQDLAVDYRFSETDTDRLMLNSIVNAAETMGEKMKYLGKEGKKWLQSIAHVGYIGSTRATSPLRAHTDLEHLGIEFKELQEFFPKDKSTLKVNPVKVLEDFRLAGHTFKRLREVEETVNAVRDLAFTAQKAMRLPDGRFKQSVNGNLATSQEKTNVFERLNFNIKTRMTGRVREALAPTSTKKEAMQPGERRFSAWQLLDSVNNYTRFKAMALSPMSAIGNFAIGGINNFMYAASGEYFNDKELSQAYWLVKGSIAKYWTRDKVVSPESRKIAEILFRYNIIGDVNEKMYHDGDALAWFFTMQKGGEFINQGATAIAQLLRNKVKLTDGTEKTVWDLFKLDDNNKVYFDKSLLPADSSWQEDQTMYALMEKVQRVNDRIHGDYRHAMMAKKDLYGRVLLLFRTWLPMAVKERFGSLYNDRVLGQQRGRYASAWEVVAKGIGLHKDKKGDEQEPIEAFGEKAEGHFQSEAFANMMKLMAKVAVPILGRKIKLKGISEVDANNLQVFARELHFIIGLTITCALLKFLAKGAAAGGDDDDDVWNTQEASILKYWYNQGERAQSELQFFFNFRDNQQIIRDVLPMYSTIREYWRVQSRMIDYIQGGEEVDTYKRGFRKGDSKLGTAVQEFAPVTRSIQKSWSAAAQIYSDKRFQ